MQPADPFIRTKLHLPFTRPALVPRPRLQVQVGQGLRGPLTLITAPAGFGKTTLIAACMAQCGLPVAWLSLDQNDNQVEVFLRYLAAAFQEADSRIGGDAAQLAAAARQALPEVILASLIYDLEAADRNVVLVLDDYQFIHSPQAHAQTAFLLEHCPNVLHVVIATRSDPPLPLARLRARGQVVELRMADLRFTEPEAANFLNDVMTLSLDTEAVAALAERTEGWIAGLQMAALSMRDRPDVPEFIESFSGTNRYILDYLLEEVLAVQPPEVQHFLLLTSILERLSAPLCDALLEAAGEASLGEAELPSRRPSASMLEYLEQSNLFLTSLDAKRIWFRYHHLFADLLRARLHQAQPDLAPRLHVRAAAWLERNGLVPAAIRHLFAAQEIERAADLIEQYGPRGLTEDDPSVMRLVDSLPPEMLLSRLKIGLYQAWFLIIQGHIARALPLLHGLKQQLAGADEDTEQFWMQTMVASALAFLAPPGSPPEFAPLPDDPALEEIPATEPILQNSADFLYGMALARRGELDHAVEVALRCIRREKQRHAAPVIPTLAPFLTRVYLMLGQLHACADLCREFLDPLRETGFRFVYTAGSMQTDLGEVLYEWNCLEDAEQHIRLGLQANEPWRNIMTDAFGLEALAHVLQAKGDYAGAQQAAERLEARLQEQPRPREFDEEFRTLRVRVLLAAGDLESTSRWADEVQRSEDFKLHEDCYRLTLARIRLAQGRYSEVEALLVGKKLADASGSRIAREIEAQLLLAAAAGQQRLPEALQLIDSSLALAEPEGYLRVFLEAGGTVRDLLAAYLRTHAPSHAPFAKKVLEAFSPARKDGAPEPAPYGLIQPLTGREIEVLRLIALGRTNAEIARELIVSPGTIKAHTASIYRKLDAANRTEAVARARQLNILS